MKKDIQNSKDIECLVDAFYGKVREDEILKNIFNDRIDDWPVHLQKMYRFWQTVLLNEHTYNGSPFLPHATLPVQKEHFKRWIELFHQAVSEKFQGKKADEAKWRAEKMAEMFNYKIEFHRQNRGAIL